MNRPQSGPLRQLVGLLATLPVIAAALEFGWPTWVLLATLAATVAIIAEIFGIRAGLLCALIATAGFSLVEGKSASDRAGGGRELAVMAGLIVVGVLFGADNPPDRDPHSRKDQQ